MSNWDKWNKRVYFTIDPKIAKIWTEVAKEFKMSRNRLLQITLNWTLENCEVKKED